MYSDAAFGNLPDGISSGRGHNVFLSDQHNNTSPIGWNSNKVKRVVGSTIAVVLSLQKAIDYAYFLWAIIVEIHNVKQLQIPITSYTDSKNLHDAIFSTKMVENKKLRCNIAKMAENIEKKNVNLKWILGDKMIAFFLTKRGANLKKLMFILETGILLSP